MLYIKEAKSLQPLLKSKLSGSDLKSSAFFARNFDLVDKVGISFIISIIFFILPLQCNTTSHPAFKDANALLDKDPSMASIDISSVIKRPSKPIFFLITSIIIGEMVAQKFGSNEEYIICAVIAIGRSDKDLNGSKSIVSKVFEGVSIIGNSK